MKFKATKKQMRENYNKIICIGYCEAHYLLRYKNPIAYSAGVYGWSCDYYDIDGILISTGYAPIGKSPDYNIIRKYNNKASKIISNYNLSYEKQKKQVNKLLSEFLEEVKNDSKL